MTTNTTASRGLAIAAGLAFTGGALTILLHDVVILGHPWTMAHALAVLTVAGVILAGELGKEAWRTRNRGASVGFWLAVIVGTGLVVGNSVGRQAEASDTSTLSVEDRNTKRTEARAELATAQKMLDEERAALIPESKSGCGKRCEGIRASIAVYEAAVKGHQADIDKLGPAEPVAPKAEKMAEIAGLFGADKAKAKAVVMLLEPFLWTLLFEYGSIVAWGYAFRQRQQPRQPRGASARLPALGDTSQTSFPVPANDGELPKLITVAPRNSGNSGNSGNAGKRAYSKVEAEADLVTRLALGETVASQDDLVARWGVNKGTVSKWVAEWERRQLIPARQQIGRRKRLAASA